MIAKDLGIKETDIKKLCENPKINKFIYDEITKQGKNDGLQSFEMAKKITLTPAPFATVGVVTSTMKLQRYQAKKVFEKELSKMYS